MIIWYTVTHACEALIAFHATEEKAETYAQGQLEPSDIYREILPLGNRDSASSRLNEIYEEHNAEYNSFNTVQAMLFIHNYLSTKHNKMSLIQKAHYAMDHGTLTKSPGTATKKEIESAFIKAIRLN